MGALWWWCVENHCLVVGQQGTVAYGGDDGGNELVDDAVC